MERTTYVLFFRDSKGKVRLFPHFFDSAADALNSGEASAEKERWIDYGYKIVENPILKTER